MRLFLAITLIFFLSACGRQGEIDNQLQQAEAVMAEHPDSALSIIQAIDPATISRNELQARYALLLSQAKDKNWIDETNDSLISIAANHYSNGDNKYYDMLSQYYLGVINMNSRKYVHCMVPFFRALELAEELNEHFWIAMAAREISYIYNTRYNNADEFKYAEVEYENFNICGIQPHTNYAILSMANAYLNMEDCEKGIPMAYQVVDSAIKYDDSVLESYARRGICKGYRRLHEYDKAIEQYKIMLQKGIANSEDSISLGLCYIYSKDIENAKLVLSKSNYDNDLVSDILRYEIYKSLNNYEKSLGALEKVERENNRIIRDIMNQDLSSATIEYYTLSKQAKEIELNAVKSRTCFIIIILVIAITSIIVITYLHHKRQQEKINKNILLAEQLRNSLNQLQCSLTTTEDQFSDANKSVKSLLSSKYELLNQLCSLVYESGSNKVALQNISNLVNDLIKQLSSDSDKISELEDLVNEHRQNLITDFKEEFPSLKKIDYKLYLFSILGFTTPVIAMLCGIENATLLYDRRRHLKDKIKALPEPKRTRFLELFN